MILHNKTVDHQRSRAVCRATHPAQDTQHDNLRPLQSTKSNHNQTMTSLQKKVLHIISYKKTFHFNNQPIVNSHVKHAVSVIQSLPVLQFRITSMNTSNTHI